MNPKEILDKDIPHAANVLAKAFAHDPLFAYIFGTPEHYAKTAPWMFGTWVRWSVMYGRAWMSPDRKAVVLMRSPDNPDMSLWSMIRAGMLPTPWKLGWTAFRRFYFGVVALLDKHHAALVGKTPHWYGWMIGAYEPGHGSGHPLLQHCFRIADERGLPIFLETATKENLSLYSAKDFEVKEEVRVSPDCTIYFMVRPPAAGRQSSNVKHEQEDVYQ